MKSPAFRSRDELQQAAALQAAANRFPPHYQQPPQPPPPIQFAQQQQFQHYYYQPPQQLQQLHQQQQPQLFASPARDDDAFAHSGQSPGAWSSQTDSSGYASPPSDASGANEWDLLSDMLMEDAVASGPPLAMSASGHFQQVYGGRQVYAYAHMPPTSAPMLFQPQPQRMVAAASAPMLPVYASSFPPHEPLDKRGALQSPQAASSPAAVSPLSLPSPAAPVSPLARSPPASRPSPAASCQSPATPATPAPQRARAKKRAQAAASPPSDASLEESPVKAEPLSADEQKKLRRRNQIACSVQRHREKKKSLVSALKLELSALTSQLELLRSQRKDLHANERLLELEEAAVTQRRKRKQSEEVNARMKKALFQQTSFLFGMRAMMNDLPAPRELEFHDWVHSYTVLSGRDLASRRREYASYFSESKMDLAAKIVLRETEAQMARLDRSRPYGASVRLLHDGTQAFVDEATVAVPRELQRECYDAGSGHVMKKYTSVFLFEEGDVGFDAFHDVAWECSKQVGVFWPGAGYDSRVQDVVDVGGDSRVYFTHLSANMALLDDVRDGERVTVESRMLCREQKTGAQSIFLWDYVDRDELYPLPEGEAALRARAITRKSCGAVVVRREPGGFVSIRSTSVKMFAASLPARAALATGDAEAAATLTRRLGLQATEAERGQDKCSRFVYDAMVATFAAAGSASSSDGSSSE